MTHQRVLLASLNLNRGLAATPRRSRFLRWLEAVAPDVMLLQETQAARAKSLADIVGYERVLGRHGSTVWARLGRRQVQAMHDRQWWQAVSVGDVDVHQVHLDPSSGRTRKDQLSQLAAMPTPEGRVTVVLGDFNLAPRQADGVFGDAPSSFTGTGERGQFRHFLDSQRLVDLLAQDPPEFTFSRQVRSKTSAFRCDLVLVNRRLQDRVYAGYDHEVRSLVSDHSAVLLSLPLPAACPTRNGGAVPGDVAAPERTAMARRRASPWARWVADELAVRRAIGTVLDYGCGRGEDVRYLSRRGFHAVGYDPAPCFGVSSLPEGYFDLVSLTFVLNTIVKPQERVRALRRAADSLAPGGAVLVVARSALEIANAGQARGWQTVGDGYWSSMARRTFQHGMTEEELRQIAACVGLRPVPMQAAPRTKASVAMLFVREGATA